MIAAGLTVDCGAAGRLEDCVPGDWWAVGCRKGRLTPGFWLADPLRNQVLERVRRGLGTDDELRWGGGLEEGHACGQLGAGCAPEVVKCRG